MHQHARDVLRALLADPHDLFAAASRLTPPRADRQWTKVSEDDCHDAWLIAWGQESFLAAHDHGQSHAAVHVLRGSLTEWYRNRPDATTWNVRSIHAGGSITVPPARIHEVHNPSRDTALSLHVYSPPLRVMNSHATVAPRGVAV